MKLIILNGPPGVGKSTISKILHAGMPGSVLLDIDKIRRSVPNYKERRAESLQISYQKAAEAVGHHLGLGRGVIIDKAISQSDTLDSLIAAGRAQGADVYEFLLFADKDTVQNRADERGYKPGSLLTRERVGEMWDKADALRKERSGAIFIDTSNMSVNELVEKIIITVNAKKNIATSDERKKMLITGIAGSGKSTVCKELRTMGYEAYGIEDIDGMFAMYRKGTKEIFTDFDNADPEKIKNSEWLCDVEKLRELLAQQKNDVAFYCGVASNMDDLFPLFDKVFLLKTDADSLHARLSTREGTDDMGNTEESRKTVLEWKDWWENEMEEKGAMVVDARSNPRSIAESILGLVSDV